MSSAWKIVVIMALASLLSCSMPGSSAKTPKRFYTLQSTGIQPPAATPAKPCFSLRIEIPAAAPGLNTSRMAYSRESHRLEYFAYHEWVSPPSRMIASAMEKDLEDSGLFTVVLTGSPDIRTDWRLDSDLQILQQDFSSGESFVRLAIRINLVDLSDRVLMASKTFSYVESAEGQNAEAGAAAANRAVRTFLQDLTVFLDESIRKTSCTD